MNALTPQWSVAPESYGLFFSLTLSRATDKTTPTVVPYEQPTFAAMLWRDSGKWHHGAEVDLDTIEHHIIHSDISDAGAEEHIRKILNMDVQFLVRVRGYRRVLPCGTKVICSLSWDIGLPL